MIYLASPYSHEHEIIRTRRYLSAREYLFKQLKLGIPLFSPIVYCHQFARDFDAGPAFEDWEEFNKAMLKIASQLWVLQISGWDKSVGVAAEMELAKAWSIPIFMKVDPDAYF